MSHLFHTALCDLVGIKYPIMQGAMAYVGSPELVAAVSNAGGLGFLATWAKSVSGLREDIRRTRALTDKPFGVNITPLGPAFARTRAEAVIEEGVKIVSTGRADPRVPIVQLLKREGITVMAVVPSVRLALRLEEEGVDAIVASGCEAGGHVGTVCSLPLIPQIVDAVKVPVAAAGGISDARGFVAALALGACGIQMGTRFLATHECKLDQRKKELLLEASDESTAVSTISMGKTTRMLRTPEVDHYQKRQREGASAEELKALAIDYRQKMLTNAPDFMGSGAGQAVGLVKEIRSAAEVIEEIIEGAEKICRHLAPGPPIETIY